MPARWGAGESSLHGLQGLAEGHLLAVCSHGLSSALPSLPLLLRTLIPSRGSTLMTTSKLEPQRPRLLIMHHCWLGLQHMKGRHKHWAPRVPTGLCIEVEVSQKCLATISVGDVIL